MRRHYLTRHRDGLTGVEMRRFSNGNIQRQIDEALATLPPDKTVAVVVWNEGKRIRSTAVARLGDAWSVMMTADKDLGRPGVDFQAAVRWSI